MQPSVVTVREAARLLSISVATLYRMRADGQIVFIKVRGRTIVAVAELERIVRTGTVPQNLDPPPIKTRPKKRKLIRPAGDALP